MAKRQERSLNLSYMLQVESKRFIDKIYVKNLSCYVSFTEIGRTYFRENRYLAANRRWILNVPYLKKYLRLASRNDKLESYQHRDCYLKP